MSETMTIVVTLACCLLSSGGVVIWLLNRYAQKKDSRMEDIKEGIRLGLENDAVIFKALREHQINGESEAQEQKMNRYFRKSFL